MESEQRQRRRQADALVSMRRQLIRAASGNRRLRFGVLLLAVALAWEPIWQWAQFQPWPVLAAAVIGIALLAWR